MLCEKCNKREATVHLTSCATEKSGVIQHDFCEDCFPLSSMSKSEQAAAIRKFFGAPPDGPIIEAEAGEGPESR
jgi:protein-arginine kinase activator protein McsA